MSSKAKRNVHHAKTVIIRVARLTSTSVSWTLRLLTIRTITLVARKINSRPVGWQRSTPSINIRVNRVPATRGSLRKVLPTLSKLWPMLTSSTDLMSRINRKQWLVGVKSALSIIVSLLLKICDPSETCFPSWRSARSRRRQIARRVRLKWPATKAISLAPPPTRSTRTSRCRCSYIVKAWSHSSKSWKRMTMSCLSRRVRQISLRYSLSGMMQ